MRPLGKIIAHFDGLSEKDGKTVLSFSIPKQSKRSALICEQQIHQKITEDKKDLLVTVEKYSSPRSIEQNRKMWALLDLMGRQMNGGRDGYDWDCYLMMLEEFGASYTYLMCENNPEAVDFLREKFRAVKVMENRKYTSETGKEIDVLIIKCFHGSSTFSVNEMYVFIDAIIDHLEEMGVDTTYMPEFDYLVSEYRKGCRNGG